MIIFWGSVALGVVFWGPGEHLLANENPGVPKCELTLSSRHFSWEKLQEVIEPRLLSEIAPLHCSGIGNLTMQATGSLELLEISGSVDATQAELRVDGVFHKPVNMPGRVEFFLTAAKDKVEIQKIQININDVLFNLQGIISTEPGIQPLVEDVKELQGWTFLPVPAGKYAIPPYVKQYADYVDQDAVNIETSFFIQSREVTVGEFRKYVHSLPAAQQNLLGPFWEGEAALRPVENISWRQAVDYAKWASQETGWNLRLPTLDEWLAACIKYAEDEPILQTADDLPLMELRGEIDHLLGNLREWSSDRCSDEASRLLGENYLTGTADPNVIGKSHCVPSNEGWKGVGFRLVRIER